MRLSKNVLVPEYAGQKNVSLNMDLLKGKKQRFFNVLNQNDQKIDILQAIQ